MIEIEPMNSTVSDETLSLVALFCGRNVADKLLYEGDPHAGTVRAATETDTRTNPDRHADSLRFVSSR